MSSEITPDTVAPLPGRIADTTADQYARYATARAARGIGYLHEAAGTPLSDRYFRYANAVGGDYAVALLTRALIEHAPEAADEVVRSLRQHFADGDSVEEFTWEWAAEYGIDAGALADTGAAKAKEATR
ncbi:hypothetical protein ABZ249_30275 [Nocardiopsis sp. NPDC006139]|uniref:hypothetical protein n=1 Tax=Nocardiopsis sp. NPDC006139 TaxID=3154578 RepID=UPI0033B20CB8